MEELIVAARNGGVVSQSLFLMVCGVTFVFAVQVVFYLCVKLWPRDGKQG